MYSYGAFAVIASDMQTNGSYASLKMMKQQQSNKGVTYEINDKTFFPFWNSHIPPTLTPGPTSGNVNVNVDPTPKLDSATGVPDLYTTPVTLMSPDKGSKKVCFKLTSAT